MLFSVDATLHILLDADELALVPEKDIIDRFTKHKATDDIRAVGLQFTALAQFCSQTLPALQRADCLQIPLAPPSRERAEHQPPASWVRPNHTSLEDQEYGISIPLCGLSHPREPCGTALRYHEHWSKAGKNIPSYSVRSW